jgi:hypothetical protein
MGYIFRAIKREMFSLATIFLVFIPMLNNTSAIPNTDNLVQTAQTFISDGPANDVRGLMQGIGKAEANEVMKVLHVSHSASYVTGHAPIFLTGTTY